MVVVGEKGPADAVDCQKARGHARILGNDGVTAGENGERAQGHVCGIADRGSHHIEPGRKRFPVRKPFRSVRRKGFYRRALAS